MRSSPRVYPRVYGETNCPLNADLPKRGLSPRVRGNPLKPVEGSMRRRSIPACTGKPPGVEILDDYRRVYPRVYGETTVYWSPSAAAWGLSPRVRGNQLGVVDRIVVRGSIPACTGKPFVEPIKGGRQRVYPRVYGETLLMQSADVLVTGLSPRVRGNPKGQVGAGNRLGSIPACTGKPLRHFDTVLSLCECQRSNDPTPAYQPCVGSGAIRVSRQAKLDGAYRQLR